MSARVAIIAGAGPAGLTAAYELLKRTDIKPIVFEATDAIGGIAQTFNYKGNRIDLGGHRFFSKSDRVMRWWFNILPLQGKPAADDVENENHVDYATEAIIEYLCRKCLPDSAAPECRVTLPAPDPERDDNVMLQRRRLSRILFRGKFFPYPIGITLRVAWRLGLANTTLIAMSYIKARLLPCKDETYLDAFFINRFGRRLYETFFKDYTEKVWGVPCGQIRAEWGAQRIKGLSLKRALAHAVRDLLRGDLKSAQDQRETSLITRFFYPKYGPGQMWETVAKQVVDCGGEVHLQTRVAGIRSEKGRITAVTVEHVVTGERHDVPCDFFFSTMPLKHLIGMMTPRPPARIVEVADGLQYRDFLTVGLLVRKGNLADHNQRQGSDLPDNWIYVQDGNVRVGRVQIFNNWSPYLVADRKNTVWLGLEYFVNEGGDLWIMPDSDMIAFAVAESERIGLLKKADVLDGCVLRMPKAYPAYFGSYGQLHVVRDFCTSISNLFCIGRNGLHRYNNQDHSMLTAMLAVDQLVEDKVDQSAIWNVNTEMVYHETKETAA
jgi:protoporphyrinogen oxidase